MAHRVPILVLLLYVTLDLSIPAMPGAFVFDANGSVEGAHSGRLRLATDSAIVPAPAPNRPVSSEPRPDLSHRPPPLSRPAWLAEARAQGLPRAVCARPAASEDPH